MNLQYRIDLLARLGEYILSNDPDWSEAKEKSGYENGWFIPEFVEQATKNIGLLFLQREKLQFWADSYQLKTSPSASSGFKPQMVGIVMAGNIPLVGFHDFLSVFISGHKAIIKPSSKDKALIKHLVEKLGEWEEEVKKFTSLLKEQLYRVARNTLQKNLDDKKQSSGDDYALFSGDGVSFSGEVYEIISGQKYGDLAEEIEMKGSVMVTALIYDKKATINYLTDILHEGLLS